MALFAVGQALGGEGLIDLFGFAALFRDQRRRPGVFSRLVGDGPGAAQITAGLSVAGKAPGGDVIGQLVVFDGAFGAKIVLLRQRLLSAADVVFLETYQRSRGALHVDAGCFVGDNDLP